MKKIAPSRSVPTLTELPPTSQLATLEAWIAFAEEVYIRARLALGQISDNFHDEALYLFLRTLNWSLESGPEVLVVPLTPAQRAALREVFHARAIQRVPAAYLTKEAWLGGLRFYVDERVIIPRSYFVELIPRLARLLPSGTRVRQAADVCTGSGCLAILLAREFPAATVDALDLSPAALTVAERNLRAHAAVGGDRVRLHQSDVFDAVAPPPGGYDLVISNPPYEPSAHVDNQDPEFAAEPRLAHDGGPDGLGIVRKLLLQLRGRLALHGVVAIEIGGLRKAVNREFAALAPEWLETADEANCVFFVRAARLAVWSSASRSST
ncbi:MAG: 50S ribosomal protein L3 N(5)-glutamine methyltransferase [Verrucomicrobia bacterium]|nr:MAG: 50S ribosomal protein L3 N(5)-glutamine methyltransferase [Verrucomicrobiota bacterium]